MACKTLLSVVTKQDDPSPAMAALEAAIALARKQDAHLEVLALGLDQTQVGYFYAGASAMIYQETLERAQADAEEVEAAIRRRLSAEDIRWSVERAVAQLGGIYAARPRDIHERLAGEFPDPSSPARCPGRQPAATGAPAGTRGLFRLAAAGATGRGD